ncbi:tRNA (uridine(54)-C5)-methyltransferase TrmA [Paraglaciecola sp.]|uniref:tRNA (uridine(54)-C5)-methyltransferase TrmA n=1 Tax=Paraglaciecola sp. TaxID=1920173 RepID=UPI0030F370F6
MRQTDIKANTYASQLQNKVDFISQYFAAFAMPALEVYPSEPLNYRMRAEFRVWHEGDDLYHIMFDQETKQKYRVDAFPPASKLINRVMTDLIELLKNNEVARRKLFQLDYLSSLSGQIVVSLLYHKTLNEDWIAEMQTILAELRQKYEIDIIGRAKNQKIVLEKDFLLESLSINGRNYQFKHIENSFTQPNATVNIKMIEWAINATKDCQGDLLELYCGLGNFTLPMAQNFSRVLATEIAKSSVAAAQFNIATNQITNVTVLRMSSEEFVQAQQQTREFRRLEGINLREFDCQTILVDPPRSGLDDDTLSMVKEYANIVYISCSPETLKQNLEILTLTHTVCKFALFDQFPYTHHSECGVFLSKKY